MEVKSWKDGQMEKWKYLWVVNLTDEKKSHSFVVFANGKMDRWTDGNMDKWKNGQAEKLTDEKYEKIKN